MSFTELLNAEATVMRRSGPDDTEGMGPANDAGDFTVTVATGVLCRAAQQSIRAKFAVKRAGTDVSVQTVTIFTDFRTDLLARDRFVITKLNGIDVSAQGIMYDTEDVYDPGGMNHHLEFPARKIT